MNNTFKKINLKTVSLCLMFFIFSLTLTNALNINIENYSPEDYVLENHFIIVYSLTGVNTYANCSILESSTPLYGKAFLGNGSHSFLITKDDVNDGFLNMRITCTDLSVSREASVHLNKISHNENISFIDIFYFLSFICCLLSILFFAPLGILKQLKVTKPIFYGVISFILIIIITYSLNDLNWFYNKLPSFYLIIIFLNMGNIFLSIPHYFKDKLDEIKRKKVFGDMNMIYGNKKK
jgi:hypothetical protein